MNKLRKFGGFILDLILPAGCISCKAPVTEAGTICGSCWTKLNFITEPLCDACGYPFPYEAPGITFCAACMKKAPLYDKARAALHYDEHSKGLVAGLKFADKTHQAAAFARLMSSVGSKLLAETDYIIPVPLHRIRLFFRRYNQAALLAAALGKQNGKAVIYDLLIKKINTRPQTTLNRKERLKNVKNVFDFNEKYRNIIKGKSILLVDDVMTTGATVNACVKVLKRAKIWKINVLTLARVVDK